MCKFKTFFHPKSSGQKKIAADFLVTKHKAYLVQLPVVVVAQQIKSINDFRMLNMSLSTTSRRQKLST